MLYDEMKQDKVIEDGLLVKEELITYMTKLKEICDEAMIGFSIQQGLIDGLKNAIIDEKDGRFIIDRELYKSCIAEVCYSPFSDTFSIFIKDREMARTLLGKLDVLFSERDIDTNKINYEEDENICIIEISYFQDRYYTEHIKKNIKNILSLKLHKND
tara:strand:+ start:9338 stop:9811 length:474 start_codon:yes stop_codon:yes gene_type:complete